MTGLQGHALDIDSVTHRYGPVTAVADVSLAVGAGEIVALLGPSGCGKTTLLRVVAGFVRQSRGSVRIDGKPIDHLPANLRNVGIVFQSYALFPHMTVAHNIAYGLEARGVPRADAPMLDVRVAAVSGVLIATVLVLMLVMERVVGLTRRLRD
jgi:putative spermidine/putrescine transport system ATP-binding protein